MLHLGSPGGMFERRLRGGERALSMMRRDARGYKHVNIHDIHES